MTRRQRLAAIFADTQDMIASTPELRTASARTIKQTRVYDQDEYPQLGAAKRAGVIRVTERRSFEAAMAIAAEAPDAHIAVHNFASPTNPGGGVKNGSAAQEESLCRCSTLYASLDQRRIWDAYYSPNRVSATASIVATDDCIWSPGIVICKTDDEFPERMSPDKWVTVDVITCAAPNLVHTSANLLNPQMASDVTIPLTAVYDIHRRRARHLLTIAAAEGATHLVLGAFGCGAFRNDPYIVANAWHGEVEAMRKHFDLIEFAIFHMPYEAENYEAFSAEFAE